MATWLDKAIGVVSPGWGLRRARAAAALAVVRSYEAAGHGRRTENWRSAGTSANTEVSPSIATVRNRARQLVRDNAHASRAIDTFVAKSVGTGIRARLPKGPDKVFKAWSKASQCDFEGQLDFYGLQSLAARCAYESGEVLVRRVWDTEGDAPVPLKLQVLEPDYIDSSKFGVTAAGNIIIAGVEIDQRGRRVAYWLHKQHPGELTLVPKNFQSTRVDASEILHFYEKRRPGQLRAVSRLAASIMRIRDLDEYQEAERVRKKIEACFVAFVHGGNAARPLGEAVTDTTTGKRNETLAPGIIEYLSQGEDVKFGAPAVSGGYGDYTKDELRAIAAGAGVTYEQLTGDLSGVNFSSIRAGQADFRDLVEQWRWIYFVPMACETLMAWFLEAAWTAGAIRTRNYEATWTAPRWPYVNPLQDVQAVKEEVKGGLTSLSEAIRERGDDPDETFAEIKKERDQLAADGTIVDTNSGTPDVTKKTITETDDGSEDPADKAVREAVVELARSLQ